MLEVKLILGAIAAAVWAAVWVIRGSSIGDARDEFKSSPNFKGGMDGRTAPEGVER